IIGSILGSIGNETIVRLTQTFSSIFSSLLGFIIPLMILGFVTKGISDLTQGAGKLLGFTTALSYISTLIAGSIAYLVAINFFPLFISSDSFEAILGNSVSVEPFFTIPLAPIIDVISALVFAFMMGICISSMRGKEIQDYMYNIFTEFAAIITKVLNKLIIPLIPFYVMSIFANLAFTGSAWSILNVLWKVFLTVIILHLIYLLILFTISGLISKKNPFTMLKNQISGYLTAIGTQSSAATIPINLSCAEKNGVSKEIREFVVPLCASIHMAGSMITITCCVTSVLLISNIPINFQTILTFILTLGVAMVASPGAPGGGVMTALPFLPLVGIASEGELASLLITLYLTQDSFGTACNVSGDNAIAVIVDTFYKKFIKK
ncbi:MAG: dicarboxylate/amino acid:cation symporter, partial [Eubacteriales bacterium]|nr:dicarboxylate/amino acid:cation symporter [Eubacteriales bacterium]